MHVIILSFLFSHSSQEEAATIVLPFLLVSGVAVKGFPETLKWEDIYDFFSKNMYI